MEFQVQLLDKLFHTIKYHFTADRTDKYSLLRGSFQNQNSPSKILLIEIKLDGRAPKRSGLCGKLTNTVHFQKEKWETFSSADSQYNKAFKLNWVWMNGDPSGVLLGYTEPSLDDNYEAV